MKNNSSRYDSHIFLSNWSQHRLLDGEYLLGDGHYTCLPCIVGPYQQPPHGTLSLEEYITNEIISHYRSRIEHGNGRIEKHYMFKTAFRGSLDVLSDALHVTAHTTNIYNCMYPAYPPTGPWSHF